VLNVLHWANLVNATSQTIPAELDTLERNAAGARQALEIGTIKAFPPRDVAALALGGLLYRVDPWVETEERGNNPCGQSANDTCDVLE